MAPALAQAAAAVVFDDGSDDALDTCRCGGGGSTRWMVWSPGSKGVTHVT